MKLLHEIAVELIGMFFGDAWFSALVLLLVAAAGVLVELAGIDPLVVGGLLLLGCPLLLIDNVRRTKNALLRR